MRIRDADELPSVIRNNKFNSRGLIETESGLLVPVYVGSQLGFNFPGIFFLAREFYPKLRELNVLPMCPFTACKEYLDFSQTDDERSLREHKEFWASFNDIVGIVNYNRLMPKSKFMIALLDGGHAVDDGLASEVSYFAEKHGPVIGIRSDFRLSENMAAPINPAIRYFMHGNYAGKFFEGQNAYDKAYEEIEKLANEFITGKK